MVAFFLLETCGTGDFLLGDLMTIFFELGFAEAFVANVFVDGHAWFPLVDRENYSNFLVGCRVLKSGESAST